MTIIDIYSKRQKRLRGELPDVYQYDTLPPVFRKQAAQVIRDVFGDPNKSYSPTQRLFKEINDALSRQYGRDYLTPQNLYLVSLNRIDYRACALNCLETTDNADEVLEVIEFCLGYGSYCFDKVSALKLHDCPKTTPERAIDEINARFREHGIGYQYVSGEIVQVDSQLLHEEAVEPALHVLKDRRFAAANAEFLKAHEHYRHGDHSSAINEALKALESTLKVICATQKWSFNAPRRRPAQSSRIRW